MRIKFLLALLLSLAARAFAGAEDLSAALGAFGLTFAKSGDCVLLKNYRRGDCGRGGKCFSTILAACGGRRLRFEAASGIAEKEAARLMRSRFTRIRLLYSGGAEYPGAVTRRTEVPASLRPRTVENGPLGYETIYLPAAANLAYGAGAEDLVRYSAAATYRYCAAARSLVQAEFFFPKGTRDPEMDPWLKAAACASGGAAAK